MHWESKMSTQRWAEVCKMLQNPSAADTKANIHHVRTMLVFRKLSSIITREFPPPEHTLPLFLNQINLVLLQSQSLTWCLQPSSSQFLVCVLWSPGQIQGFCAGQVKCRELSARNSEGTRAGKWECINGSADRAAAAGQESPAKISLWCQCPCTDPHPTKAHGVGWWQQIPCSSSGIQNKRLEQNDPRWKLLVQFVRWTPPLSNIRPALCGQDSECHSERGKGTFCRKTEEIWSPDRCFQRLGRVADACPVIPPAFIFWAVQWLWLISVLPLLQPSHFSWYFRVYHTVLTCLHPLRAFLF